MKRRSLLFLGGLFLVFLFAGSAVASEPEVGMMFGVAQIQNAVQGASREAVKGESLQPGDVIVVEGKGMVVVTEDDGSVQVRVTGDSALQYDGVSEDGAHQYTVPGGLSWFKVRPGTKLDVQTQTLVASVRGTEFGVSFSNGVASVAVLSGNVETRDSGGRTSTQDPGSSVSVSEGDLGMRGKFGDPGNSGNNDNKGNQGQGQNKGKSDTAGTPQGKAKGQSDDEDSGNQGKGQGQGNSNAGGNSGNSNAGGNSGNSNAGGNSGNSNAGGNSGNSNAGGNSGNSSAGGKGKDK